MLARFSDAPCIYCGDVGTEEHFTWSCPLRKKIWQTISSISLIAPSTLSFAIIARPSSPDPLIIPSLSLRFLDIVYCTLLSLWNFDWKFVFDDQQY